MRGLLLVASVTLGTLLVGCGGSGGEDDAGTTAATNAVPAAATTAIPPAAMATSASVAQAASPTASAVDPSPIVVGSPAADLPVAGHITAAIPVGVSPLAIAAGHGAIRVYNDMDGTLSRIDPATNAAVATIPIATPLDPANPPSDLIGLRQSSPDLAIDATSVWATKPEEQAVVRVDPQTNTVVATIALDAKATSNAVDGSSLWVALFGASSVARIDTATGAVMATISGVPTPAGIAVHQNTVWVANYFSDAVTRIDPTTNEVVGQIRLGWPGAVHTGFECNLCAIEVLANDDGVWVGLWAANAIARIDPAANLLAAVIPTGSQPRSLANDAHGVWVGHGSTTGLLLIDPATNQVLTAVPATDAPYQLPAVALSENTIWVARIRANDVVRIELHSD
jgi:YVTN family beta-propeller protein